MAEEVCGYTLRRPSHFSPLSYSQMDENEGYRRHLRRAAQRERRESESMNEGAVRRRIDATSRRAARQQVNSNEPSRSARPSTTNWWDRIGILNSSQEVNLHRTRHPAPQKLRSVPQWGVQKSVVSTGVQGGLQPD
ncbi:hypothetical protein B0H14DRAFT_2567338 [Mycena olivaceomarginata]|nr:hypothetical protein B0H14DRAFT_2567338 [Mycena olivaceomarginata]